jgi:uncharacterized membrane protein
MTTEFNRHAVKPVECLKSGFALIKDQYWLFLGVTFVGMLLGGVAPFGILLGPMMCGLYLCYFSKMRGEQVKFELLFKGFDYFGRSVLPGIVQTVPMLIVMLFAYIPMMAIPMLMFGRGQGQPQGAALGGLLAGMFGFMFLAAMVGSLIALVFSFSYPLIVERQLPVGDALKTSVRAVMGNAGGLLGLFLLNALISIVLLPFCCVAIYFALPICMASYAFAYRSVFPELSNPPTTFMNGFPA